MSVSSCLMSTVLGVVVLRCLWALGRCWLPRPVSTWDCDCYRSVSETESALYHSPVSGQTGPLASGQPRMSWRTLSGTSRLRAASWSSGRMIDTEESSPPDVSVYHCLYQVVLYTLTCSRPVSALSSIMVMAVFIRSLISPSPATSTRSAEPESLGRGEASPRPANSNNNNHMSANTILAWTLWPQMTFNDRLTHRAASMDHMWPTWRCVQSEFRQQTESGHRPWSGPGAPGAWCVAGGL